MVGELSMLATGNAAAVNFDKQWHFVDQREQSHGDVIGFYHTHPPGSPRISFRDQETMEQWARYWGKPLLCAIECEGKLRVWLFAKEGWPRELTVKEKIGDLIIVRI